MESNVETKETKKPLKKEATKGGSFQVDQETITRVNEALTIPIPSKEDFWHVERISGADSSGKKLLGIFKKKAISAEELNELRKSSVQSPGNTRTKISRLKKQYPNSSILYMLSAICTHGMLLNSSNQKEVLKGLKFATKEAAKGLISDGVSVYNIDSFYRIYFTLLDRLKRNQVRIFGMVAQDPRLSGYKSKLVISMRQVDQLISDKNKVINILNFLKKKLKSKQYTQTFSFSMIRDSNRHIENGNPKEKVGGFAASEVIAYAYAMTVSFARTPVLWGLVDEITQLFSEGVKAHLVRRISIISVRNFIKYKIAAIESDQENMAKIGKTIVKENMLGIQKLEGQSLHQSYETDPFFNLAFIAELTVGLYKTDDHRKIIDAALQAVEAVIKRDMSKNHVFTESATNHSQKLVLLRDGASQDKTV